MKKVSLLLVLSALVIISHAQLRFGVKAGINVSNITGKDVDGYRSRTGIYLGGIANLFLTPQWSAQAELLYSVQGARWDDNNEKTILNYLQVPLLARYTTATGFFAEAGPQIGFLLKAKDDDEGEVHDIKDLVKKNDVSLVIGGGYHVNPKISVNARYNAGLIKLYEEEKNSVFQLGLTYTFSAGK